MRDRLIKLILNTPMLKFPSGIRAQGKTYQTAQNVADYLLANGVIVPPCKTGTRIYRINPSEYEIIWDTFKLDDSYTFGKTVFLTREEAEEALAERNKNK